MNWKIIKVIAAFVVIFGILFLVINSTRSETYTGTELNFAVGSGSITVTNPTEQSIPVQFASTGIRTFRVVSDIAGVSGGSSREGTGSNIVQIFEFELPSGTSVFSINRGTDVTFVATAPSELEATVSPMTSGSSRNAMIAAAVAILGVLFYASNVMEHNWIIWIRSQLMPVEELVEAETPATKHGGQGDLSRSFGDNRSSRPHDHIPANTGD